jgi:AraC-like DNA-binding protein
VRRRRHNFKNVETKVLEAFEPQAMIFWEGDHLYRWREAMRLIYDTLLVYVSHGQCELQIDKSVHKLRAGSVALIPPRVWHQSEAISREGVRRHCIHFRWYRGVPKPYPLQAMEGQHFFTELVQPVPLEIGMHLPLVAHRAETAPIADLIELLLETMRIHDGSQDLMLWPVLQHLLRRGPASREEEEQEISGKGKRAIYAIKAFIDAEYHRTIGYEDYRGITQFSKSHLCKIFHEVIGTSPNNYLNSIRIFHAKRLLRSSSQNVSEIALAVGIRDVNYFSRLFKKKVGMSPSDYLRTA